MPRKRMALNATAQRHQVFQTASARDARFRAPPDQGQKPYKTLPRILTEAPKPRPQGCGSLRGFKHSTPGLPPERVGARQQDSDTPRCLWPLC